MICMRCEGVFKRIWHPFRVRSLWSWVPGFSAVLRPPANVCHHFVVGDGRRNPVFSAATSVAPGFSLAVLPAPLHRALASLVLLAALPAQADFHVGLSGKDTHPGTAERPFATLEAARDAVRELKSQGSLPANGITVWLHQGDYFRDRAFELTEPDSGKAGAPIVWRAIPGETVRLTGGRTLSAFERVEDASVLGRLSEAARAQVLQCDLRAHGIEDFGQMKSRGFGRPTTTSHCELFYRGRPMTLARWPNEGGFEKIAGIPDGAGRNDGHGRQMGELESGFLYEGDRPAGWRGSDDVWVHGYWAWDWANSYERIASLDPVKRSIKTAPPHGQYGFRPGQRFYFLNVLEELDQPGEWYLDRSTGRLYFWPPEAENPGDVRCQLSLLDQPLLELTGVSHVTVQGLVLEATRSNAVEIRHGSGTRIAGCAVRNIGNYGVTIEGGRDHGVVGCDIFDTGDGGVSLQGGDRRTLEPGGHFVENCHFARQGRWSKCYVPAIHMNGVALRASHNLIHDHPHCAILFGGNDHLIEFNEIHHIALETGDVGAIYAGRDYAMRGNRVRHNFIHHTGGVGMGSMGVYMDDCFSGTEISGNIFYKVQRAAFLGGGRDHQVVNNIFVDCNHAVEIDGRGLDESATWHNQSDKTLRDRLYAVPQALYRERYPAIKDLDRYYGPPGGAAITGKAFTGVPPENNVVEHNVCVGKWLNIYWHAKPDWQRIDHNWTGDDPGFAGKIGDDSRPEDYLLKPESPAFAVGFENLPVGRMGLQPDALRAGLPPETR